MIKIDADRYMLVEKIQEYIVSEFSKTPLCQDALSCPRNFYVSKNVWASVPAETAENQEHVNKVCVDHMALCANWNKNEFFNPVLRLAKILDEIEDFTDLLLVFPASDLGDICKLPLKNPQYVLLHDPGVDYSGEHMHVMLGSVKEEASATRKAMSIFSEHASSAGSIKLTEWKLMFPSSA